MTSVGSTTNALGAPLQLFEFHGDGREYFRIWIVNVVLTILTLGIYSAWATVRSKRYFYGNTRLMGSPFEYHARATTILKGRLVVVAALAVYIAAGHFSPAMQSGLTVLALPLIPLVVLRACAFNAVNSSWRSVRLGFDGRYRDAVVNYLLLPVLIPFTIGLIVPYIVFRKHRFLVENTRFGCAQLSFDGGAGGFYSRLMGVYFGGMMAGLIWFALLQGPASAYAAPGGGSGTRAAQMLMLVGFYVILAAVGVAARTVVLNYVLDHTWLKSGYFKSTLRVPQMVWITLSNIAMIVVTLGLFTPWARVRKASYRARNTALRVHDSALDSVLSIRQADAGALGDEAAGVFDIEIGAI